MKYDEDLPLLTNRHIEKAQKDLGEVYRVNLNYPYPVIGCVEVQTAVSLLANAYAEIEHLRRRDAAGNKWKCRRCNSMVDMVAFRCKCNESPSPWEPI